MTRQLVRCARCGKVVAGRTPREGRHEGDGSVSLPRRHAPARADAERRVDGSCWGYYEPAPLVEEARCDEPGCGATARLDAPSLADWRAIGWDHVGGRDLCPAHARKDMTHGP